MNNCAPLGAEWMRSPFQHHRLFNSQLRTENGPTSPFFSNFKFSLKKKDFFMFHLICSNRLSEEIGGGDGGWQVSVAGGKCGSYSCCKFISALTFYFYWNSWQFKEPEILQLTTNVAALVKKSGCKNTKPGSGNTTAGPQALRDKCG